VRTLIALVPIFLLLWQAQDANACRCKEPSLRQAYDNADVVAVVHLEEVTPGEVTRARAKVERAWKSSLPESVEIVTGEDCRYPLAKGETYLLYLKRGDGDELGTYQCRGNKSSSKSAPSVRWLNKHDKKNRS
jgi:hypothetical protein